MAEFTPDFEGAWHCGNRAVPRTYCPPEGCPKGYCARDAGWKEGEPSPRECVTGQVTPCEKPSS